LFPKSKKSLAGQIVSSDQETKDVVLDWLKVLAATFFDEDKQKPVPLYEKYLNLHGDCVQR
jgi:hypothetical protein